MIKRRVKKYLAFFLSICFMLNVIPVQTEAKALEISYNGSSYLYQDIQPKIVYNGKTISLTKTPALILDNIAMVPYYDVFVANGPKVKKEGYSSATKQLVLSYQGTRIVLTVNSKTAYVNGVKKTLPVAPVSVKYKNSNLTRILVPSRAICSYLGIEYNWNKASSTVTMTQSVKSTNHTVTYYRGSKAYKAKKLSVNFEGTTLSLNATPALAIGNYNMIPYYTALCKNGPKVKRSYHSKTKALKLTYGSNVLTLKIGSKTADLNGHTVKLPVAPFSIRYSKNGTGFIMVPAHATCLYLGIHYSYSSSDKSITLEKGLSIYYNGKYQSYIGKQNTVVISETKMNSTIPSINLSGIPYVPAYFLAQNKYGLGLSYSYKSGKTTLDTGFHKLVMTMGTSSASLDNKSLSMPGKAYMIRLVSNNKNYAMVPIQFVCESLGFDYSYDGSTITIKTKESTGIDPSIPGSSTTTYNDTLTGYATLQRNHNLAAGLYKTTTLAQYINYIDPDKDTTNKFQFLRLDTYRPIQVSALSTLLNTNGKGGVLEGKAAVIDLVAKRYKLDPVYFAAQCIHETGWGKSTLSKGITSNVVAEPKYNSLGEVIGFAKNSDGTYKTKKLSKSYTAYNLFGIKAYDDGAQLCGFSYAYYNKWFTVDAAIEGGAEYISKNYVHNSSNKQNTIYKFRFHPTDLNHQYATDPAYAQKTAIYMKNFSNLYLSTATFQYEYPVFKK